MADFAPPPGPPPPRVPEGWKAVWNDQYHEWFFVNLHTKASQWDKPTEPAYGPDGHLPPPGAPPTYDNKNSHTPGVEKNSYLASNNPYGGNSGHGSMQNMSDEDYARKLQAEEDARVNANAGGSGNRGASDSYYSGAPSYGGPSQQQPQYANELPPRDQDRGKKGGFLGKLLGKASSSGRPHQGYGGGGYPQQSYGQPGYGPPPMMGGGYGQPMMGGGYGGGYGGGGYGRPQRSGGLGAGGGAALGLGAGVLGGALMMDAIDDHEDQAYDQGYDAGQDDNGGGDFGGDDGGGDF